MKREEMRERNEAWSGVKWEKEAASSCITAVILHTEC